MVTTLLQGGLGNQMFQIAACAAYSERTGKPFCIPDKTTAPDVFPAYFPELSKNADQCTGEKTAIVEKNFHYEPIPLIAGECLELQGYYQSEKYWINYLSKDQVLKLFGLHDYWKINYGFVGIHVRRGDYLLHPTKHPFVGEIYLLKAITYFVEQGYSQYMFFSDDIAWCEEFAEKINGRIPANFKLYFSFSHNRSAMEDIKEYSCCQHQIMSNSTFSWWGAYLNRYLLKQVVYPATWFGPDYSMHDTKDLCPKEWIKIV